MPCRIVPSAVALQPQRVAGQPSLRLPLRVRTAEYMLAQPHQDAPMLLLDAVVQRIRQRRTAVDGVLVASGHALYTPAVLRQ